MLREQHITTGYLYALGNAVNWSALNRLGKSRVLHSSYFWFFAVPMLARLLKHVQPSHHIRLFGGEFHVTLGLPFSWKILFYASLAFSAASLIYNLACPAIVRAYQRYSDFEIEGKGSRQIIDAFSDFLYRSGTHSFFDEFIQTFTVSETEPLEKTTFVVSGLRTSQMQLRERRTLAGAIVPKERLPDAFWYVRDLADVTSPALRWACLLCYLLGFGLVSVILFQNVLYVIRYA